MIKYINRMTKEDDALRKHYHRDISAEDEWSHITGIDSKKTQNPDPMLPKERSITFTNKFSNGTKEKIVKEKSENFKDQVNTTDQYLRFVNELMKEKMGKLRQLKDDEKRFQEQVNVLQNKIKPRYDLDKLNPKYMNRDDAKAVIFHLEDEYERMKDKLIYQELIVQRTKDEVAAKRKQIQQVKYELNDLLHKHAQEEVQDPITVLKEELKNAGIDESSKIFQLITEISKYLDSKNTEKTSQP